MIQGISSPILPNSFQQLSQTKQLKTLPVAPQSVVQDQVKLTTLKGSVPTVNLFASTGSKEVEAALAKLHSSPTEENFRKSQAGFRVAIRALEKDQLLQTQQAVYEQMQKTDDYRTQVFLDDILLDVKMELIWKDRNSFQHLDQGTQRVLQSLTALNTSPTQDNFRQSQAGFRVAIRSISKDDLDLAEQAIKDQMEKTMDYRTQVFLDEILIDVKMERFSRDLK